MSEFTLRPEFTITDEQSLRDLFPPTHTIAALKSLDHIDKHARAFIERSPFLCIGTQDADGKADDATQLYDEVRPGVFL